MNREQRVARHLLHAISLVLKAVFGTLLTVRGAAAFRQDLEVLRT